MLWSASTHMYSGHRACTCACTLATLSNPQPPLPRRGEPSGDASSRVRSCVTASLPCLAAPAGSAPTPLLRVCGQVVAIAALVSCAACLTRRGWPTKIVDYDEAARRTRQQLESELESLTAEVKQMRAERGDTVLGGGGGHAGGRKRRMVTPTGVGAFRIFGSGEARTGWPRGGGRALWRARSDHAGACYDPQGETIYPAAPSSPTAGCDRLSAYQGDAESGGASEPAHPAGLVVSMSEFLDFLEEEKEAPAPVPVPVPEPDVPLIPPVTACAGCPGPAMTACCGRSRPVLIVPPDARTVDVLDSACVADEIARAQALVDNQLNGTAQPMLRIVRALGARGRRVQAGGSKLVPSMTRRM